MARGPRRSLSPAHESDRQRCCRSLEEVYAADGSGSRVSHAQERVGHSTALPSARKAGESARAGSISRLCPAGDPKASAEARGFGILTSESVAATLGVVQRGHRAADHRRTRDLVATHQQTRRRAAEDSLSTPIAVTGTAQAHPDSKM